MAARFFWKGEEQPQFLVSIGPLVIAIQRLDLTARYDYHTHRTTVSYLGLYWQMKTMVAGLALIPPVWVPSQRVIGPEIRHTLYRA